MTGRMRLPPLRISSSSRSGRSLSPRTSATAAPSSLVVHRCRRSASTSVSRPSTRSRWSVTSAASPVWVSGTTRADPFDHLRPGPWSVGRRIGRGDATAVSRESGMFTRSPSCLSVRLVVRRSRTRRIGQESELFDGPRTEGERCRRRCRHQIHPLHPDPIHDFGCIRPNRGARMQQPTGIHRADLVLLDPTRVAWRCTRSPAAHSSGRRPRPRVLGRAAAGWRRSGSRPPPGGRSSCWSRRRARWSSSERGG